jgi:hypothetical protein
MTYVQISRSSAEVVYRGTTESVEERKEQRDNESWKVAYHALYKRIIRELSENCPTFMGDFRNFEGFGCCGYEISNIMPKIPIVPPRSLVSQ